VTPPNSSPSVNTKTLAVLLALLLIPATTMAQSNGFSGASEAVAINYQGAWSAGTHVTESYDFMDFGSAKANHLYLQGHELLAPGPGVNIYAGGIQYEPDIHKLIAKTNVPAGSFVVYVQGAAGNGTPSVGKSHMSFIAGGGVQYHLAGALTWQALNAQWFRYGNTSGTAISTGLTFIFAK